MNDRLFENIQIRCPHCSKLYDVDSSEIRTEKPQFECVSCYSRFWFAHPAPSGVKEVATYLMGVAAAQSQDVPATAVMGSTFSCTKCGVQNKKGVQECVSCGLVFEKSRRKALGIHSDIYGSSELRAIWQRIMEDYGNSHLHEMFIKLALSQKNLPFASQQYRQILEASPQEEVAVRMRERIISLASVAYVPPRRATEAKKRFSLPVIIVLVGLVLMISGFVLTPLRSIIPIGAVFCAIGMGIVYFNKRQLE